MFTGITVDRGRVSAIEARGDTYLTIDTRLPPRDLADGASVACNGCCLTVIAAGEGWFQVSASAETLACTTLGAWRVGTTVNLEAALRLGDTLGGHLVSGHVDGLAILADVRPEGDSVRMLFDVPEHLARFVAAKGSVALDGVSLTVNQVDGRRFGVNIIPHTLAVTTLGQAKPGDAVNFEIDTIARYVARLLGKDAA
ncbi:riboflavin synthase alpha chain [Stella humosa]|uniref:Riboflavin synthase n=1 Tax=Stella humosa TaxID=94 RepID=A0A3N1MDT0_9PROT|nr:riboflavin synthase [Stella humosa]ROQ01439.1 riboflavin synthase alpha chain [Stella humosa]BBK31815.1 riboflavin synthase subunit alpha [Stella humosa]